MFKKGIIGLTTLTIVGCSNVQSVNGTAPSTNSTPHYIDTEISELSKELIDEQRKLALIRKTKYEATKPKTTATLPSTVIFSGLEVKRSFSCYCDVKVTLEALSALLGWDVANVYEVGHKPANGLPVNVNIKNQPLALMIEQLEAQIGNVADVRIDPNFESILIEYKILTPTKQMR